MPRHSKREYLAGILALEVMYRSPTLLPTERTGPEVGVPQETEAATARTRLRRIIRYDMQEGQTPYDVYITANDFKQVMDVSHDTAYRWLDRFCKAGILQETISGDQLGYSLKHKYASIADPERTYKSPEQIVSTVLELFEAVENA